MRFLLVEDDEAQAHLIKMALTEQGYVVDGVTDGEEGWNYIEAFTYDLILLDITLPRLDGIGLCRRIRSHGYSVPILLLTAKGGSTDKVTGLDAGADDYVVKPCTTSELFARIRALLRRRSSSGAPILYWDELCLDPSARQVTYHNRLLSLSPKEYSLLELFLRNPNRVLTQSAILEHLWSFENLPGEDTVRAHIKRLRRKLKSSGGEDIIETVYGVGYRLRSPLQELGESESEELPLHRRPEPLALDSSAPQSQNPPGVAESWERFKGLILGRMTKLDQAVAALDANTFSEEICQDAAIQAHKLAGSLGMFGMKTEYQLAQEIEQWLVGVNPTLEQPLAPETTQTFKTLVATLEQQLQQPPTFGPQAQGIDGADPVSLEVRQKLPWVLVVDHNLTLNQQLQAEALNWNIQIAGIDNIAQARLAVSENPPELVLLDPMFPDGLEEGLKFLEELSFKFPKMPVLVCTERDEVGDRAAVARSGGTAFLPKSVSPTQILEAIMDILKPQSYRKAKILAVDDDPVVLQLLNQSLGSLDFELTALQDPRQFWETLENTAPDLLILDFEMPHYSGLELCRIVRQDRNWSALPILFLSAHKDTETVQQIYQAGADDYISKPFAEAEVVTRIFNRLDRIQLLRSLAETDQLTGAMNRRRAVLDCHRYLRLSLRHHQPFCLVLLDLDRFKQTNERYGYTVGDNVLRQMGQILQQQFRTEDIVARWGGQVFLLGLYGVSKKYGMRRIERLLKEIHSEAFPVAGQVQLRVTASAGIATYPEDGIDFPTLCASADAALYQAKSAGGDRCQQALAYTVQPGEIEILPGAQVE
ncbi:MAG: response regulator [Oscillatoriales cyanobacterium SM2_3_0]|nr:response regulator [Oscillatoriales cyanobacterium SM2_3_0]